MAMNIPAPVQILRYEIPEGTLMDQFQAKIAEYAKNGTFILASGTVYYDSVSADNAIDVYTLFIGTGAAENPVIAVPLALSDNGIVMNIQDQEQGGLRFSPFIHDIYPINRSTFATESPFSERGLLVKSILTNIDYVTEYGIYSPTEDSTLPDGLLDSINNDHANLSRMLVLSYKTNSYFQILVALDREIETSTKDVIPNIYIRYAHSSRVTSDGDRPNWFPWHKIGGSSLTAGDGISITDGAVAVDDTVVRTDGEQAINGSLRVWHYATAAVTVSKKATDGNVYAKLTPNNLDFRFGGNAGDFVSITTGGTASSLGNSTYGRLMAYNDATTSLAMLSVHATDEGMYATAPSTRSTPTDNEIITYDYFRDHTVTLRTGNIYVDNVNGSDSNDGLTADTALATFDAAIALRQKVTFYSPDSYDDVVVIDLAASTTPYTYSKVKIPSRTIIRGAGRDTTSINFSAGLNGSAIYIVFQDLTLDFVGTPEDTTGLLAFYGCTVSADSCTIRDSTNIAIHNVIYTGDSGYTYMSDVVFDLNASELGSVIFNNYNSACVLNNITITGSATVSRATVAAENTSDIKVTGLSASSATITGRRYRAVLGGGISTNGAGPNAIPGSEAGTVDDTSWYK